MTILDQFIAFLTNILQYVDLFAGILTFLSFFGINI